MAEHKSLTAALAAFQVDLPDVSKGSVNPAFKSKYADLADIVKVVIPALAAQGLAWVTIPDITESGPVLRGELRHASGETITSLWPLPEGVKAQEIASWITYGRRYLLTAVTGVAPDDDDDGNAATSTPQRRQAKAPQPPAGWREQVVNAVDMAALTVLVNRAGAEGWRTQDVMDAANVRKAELEQVTGGTANADPTQ